MKRILVMGISIVMALPLVSTAVVFAVDSPAGTAPTTQTTTTQEPTTTNDAKAIQTRVEKRKAELKLKLTAVEKLNLQNKCKASQGLVSSIKGRVKGIETSRSEVYTNISTHLTDLSAKLKNKGADTATLDADIAVLQTKITTFTTDLATYKQAVSDLVDMDCKADADGFKASLQAARTALETVNKDAQAVRSYVTDTIKPLLVTIRTSLDAKKGGN